jgi:hypothetical protein
MFPDLDYVEHKKRNIKVLVFQGKNRSSIRFLAVVFTYFKSTLKIILKNYKNISSQSKLYY